MTASLDVTGRGVLVTGGNAGIGAGMATALASAGARVSIWGSNPGRFGIRANAIVPGWVDTPMFASYTAMPAFTPAVLPRVPTRRWGRPEDFGGIAVYLASDASSYHTGDTLVVDGGYSRC